MRWWVKWQKQNADAIEEMRTKHGTQILRTPPDILIAFLKAWDEIAKEESAKNPFFKKVLDSQRDVRVEGGAGEALHEPAVLVRGQLLLARGGETRSSGARSSEEVIARSAPRPLHRHWRSPAGTVRRHGS